MKQLQKKINKYIKMKKIHKKTNKIMNINK